MTNVEKLKQIVQTLRSENGCPWDQVQTHASLKPAVIEEAAEVVSGINILEATGDAQNLQEELGDLLLQVVFHAVLAEEEGLFTLEEVVQTVSEKMIRRHPNVFNGEKQQAWEEVKKAEKAGKEWQETYLKEAFDEADQLIEIARERKFGS